MIQVFALNMHYFGDLPVTEDATEVLRGTNVYVMGSDGIFL